MARSRRARQESQAADGPSECAVAQPPQVRVPHTGELVFSVDGKTLFQGYSKAKAKLDELSRVSGWTLHDLRRTVVSGMAALGVAPHAADKILNHQSGTISGVAAVYQRHEFMKERREALELWGEHIC